MFFSKNKGPRISDVIYVGETGFAKAIASWLQQDPGGVVAVWFQKDLDRLRQLSGSIPSEKFILADRLNYVGGPLLFAGHYPLRAVEMDLCEKLGANDMLVYSHLDMALFSLFGSEKLKGMMISMGMKEDEPLTHNMITKAIANAQDKIQDKCITDMHAQSEEDWFRMNLPAL